LGQITKQEKSCYFGSRQKCAKISRGWELDFYDLWKPKPSKPDSHMYSHGISPWSPASSKTRRDTSQKPEQSSTWGWIHGKRWVFFRGGKLWDWAHLGIPKIIQISLVVVHFMFFHHVKNRKKTLHFCLDFWILGFVCTKQNGDVSAMDHFCDGLRSCWIRGKPIGCSPSQFARQKGLFEGNLFLSDNNYECNTFIHFPFGHGMTWFHPLHRPISLIGNLTGILQHCIKTEGPRTPIYSALLPGIKEAKVPFKSFNMMEVTVMLIPSAGSRSQVVFRRMTGGLATSEGQRRLIAPGRRFARHAFLIGPKAPCSTV